MAKYGNLALSSFISFPHSKIHTYIIVFSKKAELDSVGVEIGNG